MLATVMDTEVQELTTHLNSGLLPGRTEEMSAHGWIGAPYGVYQTADGYITIAYMPIEGLAEVIGAPALAKLNKVEDGFDHRDEIVRMVAERARRPFVGRVARRAGRPRLHGRAGLHLRRSRERSACPRDWDGRGDREPWRRHVPNAEHPAQDVGNATHDQSSSARARASTPTRCCATSSAWTPIGSPSCIPPVPV